jgi:hypothetical protein
LKKAEKQAAKAREELEQKQKQKLKQAAKQRLNGARSNGKLLNGHGAKAAAGQLIAAKSGIFAEPASTQSGEASASA